MDDVHAEHRTLFHHSRLHVEGSLSNIIRHCMDWISTCTIGSHSRLENGTHYWSYSKACSAREHTPYSLGDTCQVEVPVKDGSMYARPMAFASCLTKCERTRRRAESIILTAIEEADVGWHQPLRRRRLRFGWGGAVCQLARWEKEQTKCSQWVTRTSMFGIQHDHVVLEFQRTWL